MAALQRLFSMFPAGWPGLALLLLRVSVALSTFLASGGYGQHLASWRGLGLGLLSAALSAGFLTPVSALLALAVQLIRFTHLDVGPLVLILDSLSLAMLGPGAYSIDAYRFGRRVLVSTQKE